MTLSSYDLLVTRLDLYTSEILQSIDRFGTRNEPIMDVISTSISSHPSSSLFDSTKQPTGVWAMLLENARGMAKALTVDLHDIVHVCKAVSQGDLTKRVTIEVSTLHI